MNYLSVSAFDAYDDNDNKIGSVSARDTAVYFSYADSLKLNNKYTGPLLYGASLKYINERLANEKAGGFALDLGLMAKPKAIKNLQFAVMAENLISSRIKFIDKGYKLPFNLKFGSSCKIEGESSDYWTNFSIDFNFPRDNRNYITVGIENRFYEIFFLRAGYNSFGDASNDINLGFGIEAGKYLDRDISVNYSFSGTYDFGNVHKIDIVYRWPAQGSEVRERKNRIKETGNVAANVNSQNAAAEPAPPAAVELPLAKNIKPIILSGGLEEKLAQIKELGEQKDEGSFQFLLSQLNKGSPGNDEDAKILLEVINALYKFNDKRAVKPFIKLMNTKNILIRLAIVDKICKFKDNENVYQLLRKALKDTSSLVRIAAVENLSKHYGLSAEDDLKNALKSEKNKKVIKAIMKALETAKAQKDRKEREIHIWDLDD